MSLEEFSVYAATVLWCSFAAVAYVECWREWLADRKELKAVKRDTLLLLLPVAGSRYRRAGYFVKMAHVKLLAGVVAAYLIYVVPPEPEAELSGTLLRLVLRAFFIADIYWFLRAKRTDRAMRRVVKEMRISGGQRGDAP